MKNNIDIWMNSINLLNGEKRLITTILKLIIFINATQYGWKIKEITKNSYSLTKRMDEIGNNFNLRDFMAKMSGNVIV